MIAPLLTAVDVKYNIKKINEVRQIVTFYANFIVPGNILRGLNSDV